MVIQNITPERGGGMPRLLLLAFFLVMCCAAFVVSNALAGQVEEKSSADGYKHKDLKSYGSLAKALKSVGKSAINDISTSQKSYGVSASHKGPKSKKLGHATKHKSHKKLSYAKHKSHKKLAHHEAASKKHHMKKKTF